MPRYAREMPVFGAFLNFFQKSLKAAHFSTLRHISDLNVGKMLVKGHTYAAIYQCLSATGIPRKI